MVTGLPSEFKPAAWSERVNRPLAGQDAEQSTKHLAFFRTVLLPLADKLDREPPFLNNHSQKAPNMDLKIHNCSCHRTWPLTVPQALLELYLSESTAVLEFPHSKCHIQRHADKKSVTSDIEKLNIARAL